MKLGTVIGRVTLSRSVDALRGGRGQTQAWWFMTAWVRMSGR